MDSVRPDTELDVEQIVTVPWDECFEATYALEVVEAAPDRAVGRIPVRSRIKQPMGIVHGGIFASLAETLASWATAGAVFDEGKVAVGLANHTQFMRPVTAGHIHAVPARRHAGRTSVRP